MSFTYQCSYILFNAIQCTIVIVTMWYLTPNRQFLGRNGPISYKDRAQMPFTEAVLLESLRLSNIVMFSLPHVIERSMVVDGKVCSSISYSGTEYFFSFYPTNFFKSGNYHLYHLSDVPAVIYQTEKYLLAQFLRSAEMTKNHKNQSWA